MKAALIVALLAGCADMQTDGDFMFLRNADADLPIWVVGNTESSTMIVWLSGGPGDPVLAMRGGGTDALEAKYRVVYWDQRGCGSAQGNAPPESFTMEQFVDDTDKVIDLVRAKYHPERVVLLGHSWGGTLASAYLLDSERRAKIAGFVDLDGNHDVPLIYPMKLAWLAELSATRDGAHWREVHAWATSSPPLTVASLSRWESYLDGTHSDFYNQDATFAVDFDLIFRSPASALAYLWINDAYVDDSLYHADDVLPTMSYSARLPEITTPALVLWGRHDGVVPLPAGEDAFARLGGPKKMVVLDGSAHFAFLEEPEAFGAAVTAWIDAL